MLEKICKRELSSSFWAEVRRRIDSPLLPFNQYQMDGSACKGGLESVALSYMRVLAMQSSLDTREVVVRGVAGALVERIKATIREVEVNARGPGAKMRWMDYAKCGRTARLLMRVQSPTLGCLVVVRAPCNSR